MASIEPLKTSIRIIWYMNGEKDSETLLNTPPTAVNKANAQKIADMVEQQIQVGIFDRDAVFPASPKRQASYFGYYIPIWQNAEQSKVSPTSWDTYIGKVANHITPYWQSKQISKISAEDVHVYYGESEAIKGIDLKIFENEVIINIIEDSLNNDENAYVCLEKIKKRTKTP